MTKRASLSGNNSSDEPLLTILNWSILDRKNIYFTLDKNVHDTVNILDDITYNTSVRSICSFGHQSLDLLVDLRVDYYLDSDVQIVLTLTSSKRGERDRRVLTEKVSLSTFLSVPYLHPFVILFLSCMIIQFCIDSSHLKGIVTKQLLNEKQLKKVNELREQCLNEAI